MRLSRSLRPQLPPKKLDIVKLADGVYAFIWPEETKDPIESNSLVVINDDDVLVVDTGLFPSTARRLAGEIKKLTDKPVRYRRHDAFPRRPPQRQRRL